MATVDRVGCFRQANTQAPDNAGLIQGLIVNILAFAMVVMGYPPAFCRNQKIITSLEPSKRFKGERRGL